MVKMLNLLAHPLTAGQREEIEAAGVEVVSLDTLPSAVAATRRSPQFAALAVAAVRASGASVVSEAGWLADAIEDLRIDLILGPGGSPAFMFALAQSLYRAEWRPTVVFAHSTRESTEERQTDGSIKKVAVFRHLGFFDISGNGLSEVALAAAEKASCHSESWGDE